MSSFTVPSLVRQDAFRPLEVSFSATINNKNYSTEIDVGEVAKKTLVSLALAFTNTFLTMTVLATKVTGIFILPSAVLGSITKPLHHLNARLAKHSFEPFQIWAARLGDENERMVTVDKMLEIKKTKLIFYPQAYKRQARDSIKVILAPVSAVLSATIAALWIALKPLYVGLVFPGMIADTVLYAPMVLHKEISAFTYAPLSKIANRMYELQEGLVCSFWGCFSK